MPKKNRKTLTVKQQKLIKLLSENLSNTGFTKTMTQMMIEAGYSETTARQQTCILSALEDETAPILNKLIEERDRAIEALKGKIGKAKYRDLVDAVDKLIKASQLLRGKPTGIVSINQLLDELNGETNPRKQKEITE